MLLRGLSGALGWRGGGTAGFWPRPRRRPGVLYEADAAFHAAYERALAATQMEPGPPMRRLRFHTLLELFRRTADGEGEVCELGVRRGLSAWLIAEEMRRLGLRVPFHLIDSFEGLSAFAPQDRSATHDMDRPEKRAKFACDEATVRANLAAFDFVETHKGWIPAPFAGLEDRRFRFVHVDVDLYEPTRDSLAFFEPRLAPGGIMAFDDYGSLKFPGARRAIDEHLAGRADLFFLPLPAGNAFLLKPRPAAP